MADKEAEKPWPLMVTNIISDTEAERAIDPEAKLRAQFDMLFISTRNKLREEGRMGDVRRLTLVAHNKDEHIVRIDRNQSTKEKECKG